MNEKLASNLDSMSPDEREYILRAADLIVRQWDIKRWHSDTDSNPTPSNTPEQHEEAVMKVAEVLMQDRPAHGDEIPQAERELPDPNNIRYCIVDPDKKLVLLYTDIGRDVDDLEALTYLCGSDKAEVVGIVTTHMIPDRRALIARQVMDQLGYSTVPIGVGSIFPLGTEHEALLEYLRMHTYNGQGYEGHGMVDCFPDGVKLIQQLIEKYGKDLNVAAVAPLTDLAKAAKDDPHNFARMGALFIQGQVKVSEGGVLVPNPAAYNIAEDNQAAEVVLGFQNRVPMTFVGKHAAYQLPFGTQDFTRFANSGHPVGEHLQSSAKLGLKSFAERDPEIFKRVFRVPATNVGELGTYSNPFDAILVRCITDPSGMRFKNVGQHALLGMEDGDPGIEDPEALKADITDTIMQALTRAA